MLMGEYDLFIESIVVSVNDAKRWLIETITMQDCR